MEQIPIEAAFAEATRMLGEANVREQYYVRTIEAKDKQIESLTFHIQQTSEAVDVGSTTES